MKRDFSTNLTSWLLIVAALMLWLGWVLLPVKIGVFFETGDFAAVSEQWRFWIWMYRIHIFGYLMTMMALVMFGAVLVETPARVLVWPGISVAVAGLLVSALAGAFYYHHGAWGANEMAGQPAEALRAHVEALRLDTEYVTCLVRFGRVFFGLGMLVLALGLLKWGIMPQWLAVSTAVLGVAAMALTMGLPDNLEYYSPVFHLNALWFVAAGIVMNRSGLRMDCKA
jgi:hypothetical protein